MKNHSLKAMVMGCAAAFSLVSVPVQAQEKAPETPATTKTNPDTFQPPKLASDAKYEFLTKRIVRLSGEVNRESAMQVISQLTTLEDLEPGKDITLIVNSPGGGVTQGLAIIDRIRSMRSKVNTVCQGEAQSMGAVILAAGTGTRTAYEDCLIMIHQVSNGTAGKLDDMQNTLRLTEQLNARLVGILSSATGVSERDLKSAMSTDFHLTPAEAKSMGLVDDVIQPVQPERKQPRRTIPAKAFDTNFPGGRP